MGLRKTPFKWFDEEEPKRTLFGLITLSSGRPEGFYKPDMRRLWIHPLTGEDFNWDKYILDTDDYIYEKPRVSIHLSGRRVVKYFNTFEEAYEFALKNFTKNKLKIEEE